MPNRHLFVLNAAGEPVPCDNPAEARAWASEVDSSVAFDQLGGRRVTTVFTSVPMGTDQDGKPLLWETAICTPDAVTVVRRYPSLQASLAGHEEVVADVKAGMPAGAPGSS